MKPKIKRLIARKKYLVILASAIVLAASYPVASSDRQCRVAAGTDIGFEPLGFTCHTTTWQYVASYAFWVALAVFIGMILMIAISSLRKKASR